MAFFNPYDQSPGPDNIDPNADPYGGSDPNPLPPPPPPPTGGTTPPPPPDLGYNFEWPGGFFNVPQYEGNLSPNFKIPGAPSFAPPSLEEARNSPGYQFRAQEGRQGLERSAAARGLLRTGGTLKDIDAWGQNFAAQEYENVFNRALNTHKEQLANYQTDLGADMQRAMAGNRNAFDYYKFLAEQQWARQQTAAEIAYNIWAHDNPSPGA